MYRITSCQARKNLHDSLPLIELLNETIIAAIGAVAEDIRGGAPIKEPIDYQLIEEIWSEVLAQGEWWSMGLE